MTANGFHMGGDLQDFGGEARILAWWAAIEKPTRRVHQTPWGFPPPPGRKTWRAPLSSGRSRLGDDDSTPM
jgi:hypothetical protein